MTPQIGKLYTIDGQTLRCEKAMPGQPCVFQILDSDGNPWMLYDADEPGRVLDNGRRVLFIRLDELKEFEKKLNMKLSELQIGQKLLRDDVEFEFTSITKKTLPKMGKIPIMVFVSADKSAMRYFTPRLFGFEIEQVIEGVYQFAEKQSQ